MVTLTWIVCPLTFLAACRYLIRLKEWAVATLRCLADKLEEMPIYGSEAVEVKAVEAVEDEVDAGYSATPEELRIEVKNTQ